MTEVGVSLMRGLTTGKALRLACCAAVVMAFPSMGMAQQLPSIVDPSRIDKQFEQPTTPLSVPEPLLPDSDEQLPKKEASKITFDLNGITFEGNTVYPASDFLEYYQDLLGKKVSLNDIYDVADKITAKYRNAGFILTRVVPPPQRVRGGILTLKVVEGFIDKIEIDGDQIDKDSRIWDYLNKIRDTKPLNNAVLERYLLLLNDLPGVNAKAVMIPSFDTPGASDLIVQMALRDYRATMSLDNRGTKFVGPLQAQSSVSINSLFAETDRLALRGIVTGQARELKYGSVAYTRPIGTEGIIAKITGNVSASNPGSTLSTLDVKGESRSLSAAVDWPLKRSRRENLILTGTLDYKNSRTRIASRLTTDDRIRALRAKVAYDFVDGYGGVNLFEGIVSQGLNVLNATKSDAGTASRANARPDFTTVKLNMTRLQPLTRELRAVATVNSQYAVSKILSGEQFGYGGASIGRAYDSSEISGDHGLSGKFEVQWQNPYQGDLIQSLQPYAFVDAGAVWAIDTKTTERRQSGTSAGIGVNFRVSGGFYGYLEVAQPLSRGVSSQSNSQEARIFFNLSKSL